ncbi:MULTISPECIES: anthranilate synthase component I [Bacillus]|uniref:Anthranilate synthase component 1 n=1 Tax=Bacillus mycoides TaxID=1405 RepID=A0ABX6ZAG8_BACMY|nr:MULTISPECIES: anthranilate synthase component I [Bacillus]AJH21810.1 anthranilate synthase component I [Bacillus mycoides]EEM00421.1 Anthranilate synthase component I [Bacillus mycoides DSM 2048]EJQ61797.1 anthranilate synthase component I [Bacillus mycoides]EJQ64567.1 anthranilate synthase component I [Bacillus mycoides]EJV71435.1 anthranilate synthase component I [Bacillus mycoides]
MMTKEEFMKQKEQRKTFLVIAEEEGDSITPISLYRRMKGKKKFLLESSQLHPDKGRYSYLGCNPYGEVKSVGIEVERTMYGQTEKLQGNVLQVLEEVIAPSLVESPFPFCGGAVGYIGYDVIRQYENIGADLHDPLNIPEVHLLLYREFTVYDHLRQKFSFVYVCREDDSASYEEVYERLQVYKEEVLKGEEAEVNEIQSTLSFTSSITEKEFCEMVETAKEHIRAGDIFQVVLSQRLKSECKGDPFALYRKLRIANPSPYMFYIDFQDYVVLGSSPESLLSVREDKVMTNPIAGTRPRGKTEQEDEEIEKELLGNEKERAEHMMLVDLGRNDIGRVSEIGSVMIDKYMKVEKYSHVMHIVSEVYGTLRKRISGFDALAYCLPAGTVSGAPKIRAMEIINTLEHEKRNVYAGAVGYISFSGNLDMALAIRTMVVKDEKAYVQAGAGIVYDSDPVAEYEETLNKARALLEVMK